MSDNEETQEPTIESLQLEIDQLKDAVAYYKKKSEEESPAALHAELHRIRRACRTTLGIVWEAERSKSTRRSSKNKYARVAMAMSGPRDTKNFNQSIVQVLTSALNDKPPARIEIPRVKVEEKNEPEDSV